MNTDHVFLHSLHSSSVTPSKVLWFSVSRSCTDKFIPKDNRVLFNAIINCVFHLQLFIANIEK